MTFGYQSELALPTSTKALHQIPRLGSVPTVFESGSSVLGNRPTVICWASLLFRGTEESSTRIPALYRDNYSIAACSIKVDFKLILYSRSEAVWTSSCMHKILSVASPLFKSMLLICICIQCMITMCPLLIMFRGFVKILHF